MNYTVRKVSKYTVIKNKQIVFAGNYDNTIRFLKEEKSKMERLGLKFSLVCKSLPQVEEDVYSYTY